MQVSKVVEFGFREETLRVQTLFPVRVTIDPGYGGNVVNVFRDSGSKTSSLSMN